MSVRDEQSVELDIAGDHHALRHVPGKPHRTVRRRDPDALLRLAGHRTTQGEQQLRPAVRVHAEFEPWRTQVGPKRHHVTRNIEKVLERLGAGEIDIAHGGT